MTYKNLLSCLTIIAVLPSCTGNSPNIVAVCEEDNVGNYIIKWETPSRVKGKVKVYASTNPDRIPPRNPIAIANVSDQRLTVVTNNPVHRYYYLMVFDNRYRIKIAGRKINAPGIQNLCDIGGYKLGGGKDVKWGKLYRASSIDTLNRYSLDKLKNTGIRTIIDLDGTTFIRKGEFLKRLGFKVTHVPISSENQIYNELRKKEIIGNNNMHEACEFIMRNHLEYKRIFEILLDKTNYPIMFHCSSNKRSTAVVSLLILTCLGVNIEFVIDDYRLHNSSVSPKLTYPLPKKPKRTVNTYEEFLTDFAKQIDKNYGNIYAYLEKEIGLTRDNIRELKKILVE